MPGSTLTSRAETDRAHGTFDLYAPDGKLRTDRMLELGQENRKMCSLFLSHMEKFDDKLNRIGDSDR